VSYLHPEPDDDEGSVEAERFSPDPESIAEGAGIALVVIVGGFCGIITLMYAWYILLTW
jgi:hypothetical protein